MDRRKDGRTEAITISPSHFFLKSVGIIIIWRINIRTRLTCQLKNKCMINRL